MLRNRPTTVLHLCGHSSQQHYDCTTMHLYAKHVAEPCPLCQVVSFDGLFAQLVLGRMENGRFIEDRERTVGEDSRVSFVYTARPEDTRRLCIPKLYPHSIALRTMGEHGPAYQLVYRAR